MMGRKKGPEPKTRGDRRDPESLKREAKFYPLLARNVRARRIAKGLTQIELAKRTGLTRATINKIENAESPMACQTFFAFEIARVLGVSLQTLCEQR